MKKSLLLTVSLAVVMIFAACGHKYYTASSFDQATATHKMVAILPAEMIFTGVQPKNLTPDQISEIEEQESLAFQTSLYNSILRHANGRKYRTYIQFQDASTTVRLLAERNITVRDSWNKNDKELAEVLGVDAVVRMRIQKERYMSDLASYGIGAASRILNSTKLATKVPIPYVNNKTNDIYASCNLVSNNATLWNDHYKASSNYNNPSKEIIENITDRFGEYFPYKKRVK